LRAAQVFGQPGQGVDRAWSKSEWVTREIGEWHNFNFLCRYSWFI
jgi:hypothetical protein